MLLFHEDHRWLVQQELIFVPKTNCSALIQTSIVLTIPIEWSRTLRKGQWSKKAKKKGKSHWDQHRAGILDDTSPRSPLRTLSNHCPSCTCIKSNVERPSLSLPPSQHSVSARREVSGDVHKACPSRYVTGNGSQSFLPGKGLGI